MQAKRNTLTQPCTQLRPHVLPARVALLFRHPEHPEQPDRSQHQIHREGPRAGSTARQPRAAARGGGTHDGPRADPHGCQEPSSPDSQRQPRCADASHTGRCRGRLTRKPPSPPEPVSKRLYRQSLQDPLRGPALVLAPKDAQIHGFLWGI